MFSEELAILDANTVQYMIDEQQDTINELRRDLDRQKEENGRKDEELGRQKEDKDLFPFSVFSVFPQTVCL